MKLFSRNFTYVGLAEITSNVSIGIFMLILTFLLEPEEYGWIIFILALSGMISVSSTIISPHAATVLISKNNSISYQINFLILLSSLIVAIPVFLIFEEINITLLSISLTIGSITLSSLLAEKKFETYAKYLILQKISLISLSLFLLHFFGVSGILFGMVLSYIPLIIKFSKKLRFERNVRLLDEKKGFLVFSYFLKVVDSSKGYLDKLILVPILGLTFLGNYAISFQVISILTIFSSSIFTYILPLQSTGKISNKIKYYSIITSFFLTVFGILAVPEMIKILIPKYIFSIEAIKIMSLSIIPITINLLYWSKYLASENSRILLITRSITTSIIVVGFIIVGKEYEMIGISYIFVISHFSEMVMLWIYSRKINYV